MGPRILEKLTTGGYSHPDLPDPPTKPELPPDHGAPKPPAPVTPGTPPTVPTTPPATPPPTPGTKQPVALVRALAAALLVAVFGRPDVAAQSSTYTGKEPTYVIINGEVAGALQLNSEQRTKLEVLEAEHQHARDALLAARDDMEEATFQTRMNALSERRVEQVKAILTPKQFEQWRGMGGGKEGFDAEKKQEPDRP
jgi:hypothetical protein